jgi:hypothetical protein
MVDTLDCPGTDAWTLRIGGPQPDEDRNSLLFTPTFPCGVERSVAFNADDDAPLVRIATGKFCLGDECDPTRLVLLRGHVQAIDSQRGPGVIDPLNIDACEGASAAPRVKIEVWPCGWPGGVIIDSDSEIVVPAGDTSINVLAPGPRVGGVLAGTGGWVRGRTTLADTTSWTDVTLRIAACPLDCYVPPGVLSEWFIGIDDTTDVADRILIRPRRARRLELGGIAAAAIETFLLQDLAGALPAMGRVVWPTTPTTLNITGAFQSLIVTGQAAGTAGFMRWEVR